ncbi:MAG: PKD domain-containing protein [Methanomassiliicoccales archaeon]|nr:PKD domain-containing protein [Methanomassiliicoccales archaeon]
MQRNKTWKLATGLMVLILLATPLLAFVPSEVSAATGNKLSINVFDNDGPIIGATASLTEVRKQATTYSDNSDSAGLIEFTPATGYYQLRISATGYYDFVYSDVIRFDGISARNLGNAMMTAMATANKSVQFNVTSGSTAVSSAVVTVKETYNGVTQTVATGSTNASGLLNVTLHTGSFTAVVKKSYFVTKVVALTVSGNMMQNVSLSASASYSGTVTVAGSPATSVKAYLVDKDDPLSAPDAKIIIAATVTSNFFRFDAYPGNFTLLVDASGALAQISDVTITGNDMTTVALAAQNLQTEENTFAFAADDWNTVVLTKALDLDYDYTVPGIAYSYLPSARMQIDLALGDGDGVVEANELTNYTNVMASFGPWDVTTDGMLTVSSIVYYSEDVDPTFSATGLDAAVSSTSGFQLEIVANYESASAITNGLGAYTAKVYTSAATSSMAYNYTLALPNGDDMYELVKNVTSPTSITVVGYTEVTVVASSTGGYATLTIDMSEAPVAAAAVVTGTAAYKVLNGSTLMYYIVSSGVNTTFTATGSSDPNGNPLSYIWNFGDSSSATVTTLTTNHIYTVAKQVTANLTVTDKAGLVAYKEFKVRVDNVAPVIVMTYNDSAVGSILTVDQNSAVTFTSEDSYDRLNATADGLIASYAWNFGNGNAETILLGENQNVSNTWTKPGTFSMYLNVTDVVNHTTSKMVTVTVLDTKAPVAKFTVKLNGTTVTTAKENQTLVFNCSASTDDSEIVDYFWNFGDGTNSTEQTPSHNFTSIATFSVKLVLTDEAGNKGYYNYSLKITTSNRPDIRVNGVTFDPTKFTEGEKGTIYVNVTNVGSAKAEGLYVQLFKVNLDGDSKLLTDVGTLWVNDSEATYLNIGETGMLRIEYSFDSKGDYTLQVNVTANNEVSSVMGDNSNTVSLEVQEASWKAWLLYGGIFAVVIVVIVLFLFRKKLPMVSGKKAAAPPTKKK